MNLYKEELMDHFRHPRNNGIIENPDFKSDIFNPSCGDEISFTGKIAQNKLIEVKFTGKGCVISQASASMLTEFSKNKELNFICNLTNQDILNLIGIELGPNRIRCALLSLEALKNGIDNYLKKKESLNA